MFKISRNFSETDIILTGDKRAEIISQNNVIMGLAESSLSSINNGSSHDSSISLKQDIQEILDASTKLRDIIHDICQDNTYRLTNYLMEEIFTKFELMPLSGIENCLSCIENNIEMMSDILRYSPLVYSRLSDKLKRNPKIIEVACESCKLHYEGVINLEFPYVLSDLRSNPSLLEKVFGNSSFRYDIISDFILAECIEAEETTLIDTYKEEILADDDRLYNVIFCYGFVGFLKGYEKDSSIILRMINKSAAAILLADEEVRNDRYVMWQAIKKDPLIVFKLDIQEDDPFFKTAFDLMKKEADSKYSRY